MKILFLLFFSFLLSPNAYYDNGNLVPDESTAIKIAEAIWLPIYGDKIYTKQPFNAVLIGDTVWHVFGSLPHPTNTYTPQGDTTITIVMGGVPHIFIRKSDSKIIEVYHTK